MGFSHPTRGPRRAHALPLPLTRPLEPSPIKLKAIFCSSQTPTPERIPTAAERSTRWRLRTTICTSWASCSIGVRGSSACAHEITPLRSCTLRRTIQVLTPISHRRSLPDLIDGRASSWSRQSLARARPVRFCRTRGSLFLYISNRSKRQKASLRTCRPRRLGRSDPAWAVCLSPRVHTPARAPDRILVPASTRAPGLAAIAHMRDPSETHRSSCHQPNPQTLSDMYALWRSAPTDARSCGGVRVRLSRSDASTGSRDAWIQDVSYGANPDVGLTITSLKAKKNAEQATLVRGHARRRLPRPWGPRGRCHGGPPRPRDTDEYCISWV